MAKAPRKTQKRAGGAPLPKPSAIDRSWRIRAAATVGAAVVAGAFIGFVVIPAGQKENGHLSMGHAMARAAGLEAGSPAMPQPLSTASSIPVSTVRWDPKVLAILAAGRTRRGAEIAAQTCAACHGEKGLSQSIGPGPAFPSLAGQSPYAIYKQLHDFQSGARVNPQMSAIAQMLAPGDLANVAAYYSDASKEYAAVGKRELLGDSEIQKLAEEGDSHRRLPACLACHVNNSGGPIETPVITGQSAAYLLTQLNAFAAGERKNDIYGRMRDVSAKLTPKERAALARYFEGTL
ncbi:MAG: c-type cytochrome [Sphingomicrobium sp.]